MVSDEFVRHAVLVVLVVCSAPVFAQDRQNPPTRTASSTSKDESIIRANVAGFVKAFNASDAKAVAHSFAPEAQIVDEDGNTTQGRDAIERTFATVFGGSPQSRIEVHVESIRFIGTALAIETGTTKVVRKPGDAPDVTRYTAVHVKSRAGQWQMSFVRDTQGAELTNYERLKPLEWMIGDWIDESQESVVVTSCNWSKNKNFILQEIKVRMQGRDAMDLSQRIGWDPLTKRIKSWIFDSEGGYAESVWTRDGDRWLVKATAVRRDGTTVSATNIFTRNGKDAYTWLSRDRVVGGDVLPTVEVKVVRKPPEPTVSK